MEEDDNSEEQGNTAQGFFVPDVPRTYVHTKDVVRYSYFLKRLGISQKLQYGDWIYVQENGVGLTKIYHDKDVSTFEDFNAISNGKFLRLISQDEAVNLLKCAGFIYTKRDAINTDLNSGAVEIRLVNIHTGSTLSVISDSLQGAHVKAASLIYMQNKFIMDTSPELNNTDFIDSEGEQP